MIVYGKNMGNKYIINIIRLLLFELTESFLSPVKFFIQSKKHCER